MPEQKYRRLNLPENLEEREEILRKYIGKQIRISDWNFYSETNPGFVEGRLIGLAESEGRRCYVLDLISPDSGIGMFRLNHLKILKVTAG